MDSLLKGGFSFDGQLWSSGLTFSGFKRRFSWLPNIISAMKHFLLQVCMCILWQWWTMVNKANKNLCVFSLMQVFIFLSNMKCLKWYNFFCSFLRISNKCGYIFHWCIIHRVLSIKEMHYTVKTACNMKPVIALSQPKRDKHEKQRLNSSNEKSQSEP